MTVNKYEDFAVWDEDAKEHCFFCEYASSKVNCHNVSPCRLCPIGKTEENRWCCDNKKDTFFAVSHINGLEQTRKMAYNGDIPSCLALMVYFWGFVNFGENFIGGKK